MQVRGAWRSEEVWAGCTGRKLDSESISDVQVQHQWVGAKQRLNQIECFSSTRANVDTDTQSAARWTGVGCRALLSTHVGVISSSDLIRS